MPGKVKLKGKHKRGERGSVEEEQQTNKRVNMADVEVQSSGKDKEALLGAANFPFVYGRCHLKRSMPFWQNGRCHLKRSMPFLMTVS